MVLPLPMLLLFRLRFLKMKKPNKYIPTNIAGYFVDRRTRAVINRNESERILYKMELEKIAQQKSMESLKSEVEELKSLIKRLIREE